MKKEIEGFEEYGYLEEALVAYKIGKITLDEVKRVIKGLVVKLTSKE